MEQLDSDGLFSAPMGNISRIARELHIHHVRYTVSTARYPAWVSWSSVGARVQGSTGYQLDGVARNKAAWGQAVERSRNRNNHDAPFKLR